MWAATNHAILRNLRSIRSRRASICKIALSISRSMGPNAAKMAATSEGCGKQATTPQGPLGAAAVHLRVSVGRSPAMAVF